MKRAYVRPTIVGERFVANEYVAACGDTEYGKYKFTCDAGGGVSGDVYRESNGKPGFQNGYYIPDGGDAVDVIIWRGKRGDNIHCTTNLNRDSWETTKS